MMEKIGDRKRALEFLTTAENLQQMRKTLAEGKKIDLLKADPPITPAVILAMDDATRLKKFNEIIEELYK